FSSLVNKYQINANEIKIFDNYIYHRKISAEGNSFYRTIMYLVIEYYIITKDLNSIYQLISLMENKKEEIKEINNIEYYFSILEAILFYLENNNIQASLQILFKAFNDNETQFDLGCVLFLRKIILEYYDDLFNNYKQTENISLAKCEFPQREILIYNELEPDILILKFLPFIFNVNFELIIIDSDNNNPKIKTVSFISDKNPSESFIHFIWIYGKYFPIYSKDILQYEYNSYFPIVQSNLSKNLINLGKFKCEVCRREREKIGIINKKYSVCSFCLNEYLDKIFSNRAQSLSSSNFIGTEYYTRNICLKNDYYITDDDVMELTKMNIINHLYKELVNSCFSCASKLPSENQIILKCQCRYCLTCLETKIQKSTKNLTILNSYEKRKTEENICECDKNFDYEEALKFIKFDKEEKYKEAEERLNQIIKELCMICERELYIINEEDTLQLNEQDQLLNKQPIQIVVTNRPTKDKIKGIDYSNEIHLIGSDCFKNLSSKFVGEEISLNCNLCSYTHYIQRSSNRKIMREAAKNEAACCATCIIL
ncbi:MAG: hypothetical protein MJ252_02375, partial [archaeon]|nr:hypothetical protein [archaeon]